MVLAMLLGVKRKVLEIKSQKILRPDPGLYSQYFPSYDIFCETQIFRHPIFNQALHGKKKFGYNKKWHNSEIIVSTDLGQVSKFSLIRYLDTPLLKKIFIIGRTRRSHGYRRHVWLPLSKD